MLEITAHGPEIITFSFNGNPSVEVRGWSSAGLWMESEAREGKWKNNRTCGELTCCVSVCSQWWWDDKWAERRKEDVSNQSVGCVCACVDEYKFTWQVLKSDSVIKRQSDPQAHLSSCFSVLPNQGFITPSIPCHSKLGNVVCERINMKLEVYALANVIKNWTISGTQKAFF